MELGPKVTKIHPVGHDKNPILLNIPPVCCAGGKAYVAVQRVVLNLRWDLVAAIWLISVSSWPDGYLLTLEVLEVTLIKCQDMPRYAKIPLGVYIFWQPVFPRRFRCVGPEERQVWMKLELCARCASVAPTRAVDNTTGPWKCSLYPGGKISAKMQDETLRSNSWNWELKIKLIKHVILFFGKLRLWLKTQVSLAVEA